MDRVRDIRLIEAELNGKKLAFSSNTEFLVQVGKGEKGSYKTRYKFFGDEFARCIMIYNGINICNGYKKRLISNQMNKRVLDRQFS